VLAESEEKQLAKNFFVAEKNFLNCVKMNQIKVDETDPVGGEYILSTCEWTFEWMSLWFDNKRRQFSILCLFSSKIVRQMTLLFSDFLDKIERKLHFIATRRWENKFSCL
jgi:hypothetical protein